MAGELVVVKPQTHIPCEPHKETTQEFTHELANEIGDHGMNEVPTPDVHGRQLGWGRGGRGRGETQLQDTGGDDSLVS